MRNLKGAIATFLAVLVFFLALEGLARLYKKDVHCLYGAHQDKGSKILTGLFATAIIDNGYIK